MTKRYKGSCLCGSVRYEVDTIKPHVSHCNCPLCRKFKGAIAATLASTDSRQFRWIQGEELLKAYTAENGTTLNFCTNCGSSLTFSNPKAPADIIEISIGTIDDDYTQSRQDADTNNKCTAICNASDDDVSQTAEESHEV